MKRICKTCLIEKKLEEFVKQKNKYRFLCKECRNTSRRTGKTRYRLKKGNIPWNKGRYTSEKRGSGLDRWASEVKERDGYECKKCGSKDKLEAHHIVPWKENKELKYDLANGITICRTCHLKIEPRRKKGYIPSEESRKKASISSKGQRRSPKTEFKKGQKAPNPFKKGMIPWNKGTKGICKAWNKGLKKEL
jgi:5-methylcytosine-specific restriction endonuclease McrA